jgi:sialidase-1
MFKTLFIAIVAAATIGSPAVVAAPESGTNATPSAAAASQNEKSHFTLRDGLANCKAKFEKEKTGRVAFLGGSITYNPGWRNGVMAYLQKTFPQTQFDFIAAGIPSVGSNGHAFRLQRDILMRGPVDLLFIESAVNDVSNFPDKPELMLRATEGIVHHIRADNPQADIVQMHFAAPELLAAWAEGKMPQATVQHEKVAAHYGCVSLDIAQEVADRIQAKEFTWQSGFGANVHPPAFGQKLYLAAMTRMLDAAFAQTANAKPHPMPEKMVDPASYANGRFGKLEDLKLGKGFELVPSWKPAKGGTRPGFVNVPAAVASAPGSELGCDFEGTAFGFFLAAGYDTCVLEYSVDNGPFKEYDTYTKWSGGLHLPWPIILADGLAPGKHTINVRTTGKVPNRTALHIIQVLLN